MNADTPIVPDPDRVVLSVIAPCFNEEHNVPTLVARTLAVFDELAISAELLLVDDGSQDRTTEVTEEFSLRDRRVRGLRHDANSGIESAWKTGLESARGALVCLIDADLQNRPEDIARLYRAYLLHVPDVVQAVRHPAKSARRRQLFSRGLNRLLNYAFDMNLRDSKSGFLLCRKENLRSILSHKHEYRYYQSFVGVAAGILGYSIAEVDTEFEPRHAGRSFLGMFPILVSLRILWELVKFRVETRGRNPSRSFARPQVWPVRGVLSGAAGSTAT